jgi:hypothetical protein
LLSSSADGDTRRCKHDKLTKHRRQGQVTAAAETDEGFYLCKSTKRQYKCYGFCRLSLQDTCHRAQNIALKDALGGGGDFGDPAWPFCKFIWPGYLNASRHHELCDSPTANHCAARAMAGIGCTTAVFRFSATETSGVRGVCLHIQVQDAVQFCFAAPLSKQAWPKPRFFRIASWRG